MRQRANSGCVLCLTRGPAWRESHRRPAIRAETCLHELIASYSAPSVGRRASIRPRGGVGSAAGRPGVVGMRSDRWRSQATRAAAPAVPGAGIHHSVIPIALRPARPGLRAALLASVCVGALAVVPATAQVSGTWTGGGAPVTNEWTQ